MGVSLGNVSFDASAAISSADALKKAFDGVNATLEKFSQISKTISGTKIDSSLAGLASSLQQLINLQGQLGNAATRAADAQARAAERAQRDAARQAARQAGQAEGTRITDDIVSRLQGINFNPANFAKVQTQLASIQQAAARGAVTFQGYQQVLAALNSGSLQALPPGLGRLAQTLVNVGNAAQRSGGQFRGLPATLGNASAGFQAFSDGLGRVSSILRGVFLGNVIANSFSRIQNALEASVKAAADYSIKIAEVQTISQDVRITNETLRESLNELSIEFGKPINDVVAAQYEAISNQVVGAGNSVKFLRDALEFANVSVSTSKDSVNLLSSVLNSYGLEASRAGAVSAQLFKTIEVGRVQASQIADSFGRVLPLARSLGVELTEVQAALATLTNIGITPDEAITQIINVLIQLQKPTKTATETIRGFGFATAEEAIKARGLIGTLQLLATQLNNVDAAPKLFDESRAQRGFIGLIQQQDQFILNQGRILNAQESYNRAIEITRQASGRQLFSNLEEVNTLFREGFGQATVNAINRIAALLKDLGISLSDIGRLAASFAGVATAALAAASAVKAVSIAISAVAAAGSAGGITALFASLPSVIGLSVAAGTTLALILSQLTESETQYTNRVKAEAEARIKEWDNENNKRVEAANKATDSLIKLTDDYRKQNVENLAKVQRDYDTLFGEISRTAGRSAKDLKVQFDNLIGTARSEISNLEANIRRLETQKNFGERFVSDFQRSLQQGNFERALQRAQDQGQGGLARNLVRQRVSQLQQQAETFTNQGNIQQTVKAFEEINSVLAQQYNTFRASNASRSQLLAIERQIRETQNSQFEVVQKLTQEKQRQIAIEKQRVESQKQIVAQLDVEQTKLLNIANNAFTSSGKIDTTQFRDAQDAFSQLEQTAKRTRDLIQASSLTEDVKAKALLDFEQRLFGVKQGFAAQLKQTELNNIREKQNAELQAFQELRNQQTRLQNDQQSKQKPVTDNINVQLQDITGKGGFVERLLGAQAVNNELRDTLVTQINSAVASAEAALKSNNVAELQKRLSELAALVTQANQLSVRPPVTALDALTGTVKTKPEPFGALPSTGTPGAEINQSLITSINQLADLKPIQAQLENVNRELRATSQILGIPTDFSNFLPVDAVAQQAASIRQQLESIKTPIAELPKLAIDNPITVRVDSDEAEARLRRLIELQKQLGPVRFAPAGPETTQAFGGIINRFAGGGIGTDNIIAALSKGEFVMKESSTRKFYSQLVSMNAGLIPRFANGGPVTNFGDVNVSVTGGSTDEVTLRRIGAGLRRELRKQTLRLK